MARDVLDKGRAVRLPVHVGEAHRRLQRAIDELEQLAGRAPTDEELAASLGVPVEEVLRLRRVGQAEALGDSAERVRRVQIKALSTIRRGRFAKSLGAALPDAC